MADDASTEAPAEHPLLRALADVELPRYPDAMDHLVAAALFDSRGDLCFSGRNHYRVPGSGMAFDYVHAEEDLLQSLDAAGGAPEGDNLLVVTLEPCDERADESESCSSRVARLAAQFGIRRVLAGCLDDGMGVPVLAASGIDVEVIVGDRIQGAQGRGLAPNVLLELRRLAASSSWGHRVTFTEMHAPDAVNSESCRRQRAALERLEQGTADVLAWIQAQAPSPEQVVAQFPRLFGRAGDLELLTQRLGAGGGARLLLPLVKGRVRSNLKRERDALIMEAVRDRGEPNAER